MGKRIISPAEAIGNQNGSHTGGSRLAPEVQADIRKTAAEIVALGGEWYERRRVQDHNLQTL